MPSRYFNEDAYPFIQGDNLPSYVFSIYDSDNLPADLSGYPSLIVTAKFREKNAAASLAQITCTEVDASIGQFKITSWPSAVSSASEGKHELEIQLDYQGDGTEIQTVYNLVQFDVVEQFGDVS